MGPHVHCGSGPSSGGVVGFTLLSHPEQFNPKFSKSANVGGLPVPWSGSNF